MKKKLTPHALIFNSSYSFKKNLLSKIYLVVVASFFLLNAKAQNQKEINGTVTDDKGAPLEGATVLLKGTKNGTNTNSTGNYVLSVPTAKGTLVFSFAGFQSQEINIGSNTTIYATLLPQNKTLTDVVVTGYTRQSKRDVTGAVSTVSTDVISKTKGKRLQCNSLFPQPASTLFFKCM